MLVNDLVQVCDSDHLSPGNRIRFVMRIT